MNRRHGCKPHIDASIGARSHFYGAERSQTSRANSGSTGSMALILVSFSLALCLGSMVSWGAEPTTGFDPAGVLSPDQWKRVDRAVERGLVWLSRQQISDGQFATGGGQSTFQPGITAIAAMAFLSKGHRPGEGTYGAALGRSVDFVLATQSPDGMLSHIPAEPFSAPPADWDYPRAHAFYNHAIAGLMLTESYAMLDAKRNERCQQAIEQALLCSRGYQLTHKPKPQDQGGWRYMFINNQVGSDLSVTAWQLMFYRSAKNAEFDVPQAYVDDAMGYVRRCFDESQGRFRYALNPNDYRFTRAMCGAGILSLALGGEHDSPMSRAAADSLLRDSFREYGGSGGYQRDQYHYSVYYCTLGMFQLGGHYWKAFYPPVVETLLDHQQPDGSWMSDRVSGENSGPIPTTAMAIMALTIADQLIPVYQR